MKDQLYRISRSEFYEWLFGPEKFSELSRNGPQIFAVPAIIVQKVDGNASSLR